jgi:acetyl esterase/lipase
MCRGSRLAATISLKAASLNLPMPIFQMLILPVIDNTATASTTWSNNVNAPWLTPPRMIWYRKMYLPNELHWKNWDVSPNFAPKELLAKSPQELDILCQEAENYGALLKQLNVNTTAMGYEGSTHSLLILDGV